MRLYSWKNPKPLKTCAVVRYGGLGDALQTASVLPWLKEQGYHITVYTVPNGWEVLKHNPHIDRFVVQNVDDVPNEWLGEFWKYLAKRYDKFINFSESVERTLLAMPNTTQHGWSHEMRHKYLNHNYLEFMHDIAGVPYKPHSGFYATLDEDTWARHERSKFDGPVILWCLGGSAVHKHWPWLDEAVEAITKRGIHIVLAGDKMCKTLEEGFEDNRRVHRRSWVWGIRQSMTFARVADLVVGSETGVMNAVAFLNVPKIVTLSHSSHENLTRDWVNCSALTPVNTPCYPCHRLHYGFEFCRGAYRDGQLVGALCQGNIKLQQMMDAVNFWIKPNRRAA